MNQEKNKTIIQEVSEDKRQECGQKIQALLEEYGMKLDIIPRYDITLRPK